MERKCWTLTSSRLYPNLYIILVGPPGVGKSVVVKLAGEVLRALKEIFVAADSVSSASLIDNIKDSQRAVIGPFPYVYNALQVIASELGVFIPAYDPMFMNTLTKMYDGESYEERRRTGKVQHVKIENPLLSILGSCTPSYLNSFLPEGAWDQGFTSRTIFVYHGTLEKHNIFTKVPQHNFNEGLLRDLVVDLNAVNSLRGEFIWTEDAMAAATFWFHKDCPPVPEHAKLKHYLSRRITHVLKLAMVSSVNKNNEMKVTAENFEEAKNWLLEAEDRIPEIFVGIATTEEARAIEDLVFIVKKHYERTKKPVGEHILVDFLKDRVPIYTINKILEVLTRTRKFRMELVSGVPAYVPLF